MQSLAYGPVVSGTSAFKKNLKNFNRMDCGGLWVNRTIIQDKRGVIYVGGEGGIREFDGVTWRPIDVPGNWVNALAVDESGTIYVGGNNEIGKLSPNDAGFLEYRTLNHLLGGRYKQFSILEIHATKEGVYFNGGEFLLLTANSGANAVRYWQPAGSGEFDVSFYCENQLYVWELNAGLKTIKERELIQVPGCGNAQINKLCLLMPYTNGNIKLLGTRAGNLFIHNGKSLSPFESEADEYLKNNRLLGGIRLSSGNIALATIFGGVVVIDDSGKIKEIFDERFGLPDNLVNLIFEDLQGNLWLALEMGVSKIENSFPISPYRNPPKGIYQVTRHKQRLCLATVEGLFFLSPGGKMKPVPRVTGRCHIALSAGDDLLVGKQQGLYLVEAEGLTRIFDQLALSAFQSRLEPRRIWVQTAFTIVSLYRGSGGWEPEYHFNKGNQFHNSIVEDGEGNLWLGAINRRYLPPVKGVLKINVPARRNAAIKNLTAVRYGQPEGLPTEISYVFRAARHVIFATAKGIYRFDGKLKTFLPVTGLGSQLTDIFSKRSIRILEEDSRKNIWIIFADGSLLQLVAGADGNYMVNEMPFLRIPPYMHIQKIYPEPTGDVTWLYSVNHLIRFDAAVHKDYRQEFHTLIRKVTTNGRSLFGGYRDHPGDHGYAGKLHNISFEFAAPFYESESSALYRYVLEGSQNDWSGWTPETQAHFANLEPGNYRFRVQGKNVYRQLGSEAAFNFEIIKPWYRSWWAFGLYAVILSMLVWLTGKWRRANLLEKEKFRLESIVQQRVKEINWKNRRLQQQTHRLQEQSRKLSELDKIKSRFFANISHEFRTPITLIMGPLQQILDDGWPGKNAGRKRLTMMLRNSQRLLRLIDQLLELSRLEGGHAQLMTRSQDMVNFVKGIVASFEPVAAKNELDLVFRQPQQSITLFFDTEKLEVVLFNLLSNAVKFTPGGGQIIVSLSTDSEGFLFISVKDTGPGIPREQAAHIFDRFYQSDSTFEYHRKGSGIGLAIAKELVELHNGTIEVISKPGEGSEFIIKLPPGSSHLQPGQIMRTEEAVHRQSNQSRHLDEKHIHLQQQDNPPEVAGQRKDIILLVEDSEDFRQYMREALEPGYSIISCVDGAEGIQKAKQVIPDLIISDIMMPGIDGFQLCKELKAHRDTCHIPIILLTARASLESTEQGLGIGADDYITKPFSSRILNARIKNLIQQRRRLQQQRRDRLDRDAGSMKDVESTDDRFYNELVQVLDKNISDPDFNVEQLKGKMMMGRTSLYRKIMALTGLTPTRFIRTYRMMRAAKLFQRKFGNVSEVAVEVGFTNLAYFSQCFKEEFQTTPSNFLQHVDGPPATGS